jgi:hypothetical protein
VVKAAIAPEHAVASGRVLMRAVGCRSVAADVALAPKADPINMTRETISLVGCIVLAIKVIDKCYISVFFR